MELFATTGFGRTPSRFTPGPYQIGTHRVQTSLAFVRLEKPLAPRAFLWSSSSSRCTVGSIPPVAFGPTPPACADVARLSDPPEPLHLSFPVKGPSCLRLRAPDPVFETLRAHARFAVDRPHFLSRSADALHMPLHPLASAEDHVSGCFGGLGLAPVLPSRPCDPPAVQGRDTLEPVSAIVPIHSCIPTRSFSPLAPIRKCRCSVSPSCVRADEGSPGCPRERREPERFTPLDPPGRAYFLRHVRRTYSVRRRLRAEPWISRRLQLMLRRSSRPLPRCSVTSTAFPVRKTFHRKELFPRRSTSRWAPPRLSSRSPRSRMRLRGWPSPALPTAPSPDAFASPQARFRAPATSDRGPRSRTVETGASRARFSGPAVTGVSATLLPSPGAFRLLQRIVKRRVAFSGRDPCSPRRSVRRCPIGSAVFPPRRCAPCGGGAAPVPSGK